MGDNDLLTLIADTKSTFQEIAKQASNLGAGLQNAAPGNQAGTPNVSIQYLLETADRMNALAEECDTLTTELSGK